MYYIAFTLGLLSSLHCVGMCGPLVFAAVGKHQTRILAALSNHVLYHSGRMSSYMILGLIFGFFGSVLALTGIQKSVSIASGLILFFIFIMNVQPDNWLRRFSIFGRFWTKLQSGFSALINHRSPYALFGLGLLNGLLPCGMVYIALSGAVTVQNIQGSMGFMMFFGLGTLPALLVFSLFDNFLKGKRFFTFQKIYPVVSLVLGLYLIYRGIFSSLPLELSFYEALKNPVMCH